MYYGSRYSIVINKYISYVVPLFTSYADKQPTYSVGIPREQPVSNASVMSDHGTFLSTQVIRQIQFRSIDPAESHVFRLDMGGT